MSPDGGRRGSFSSTLLPLAAAVCALIVVREGLQHLFPSLSYWIVFVVALVVGWLTYSVVERLLARRGPHDQGT